jgi:hypothetical protein
VIGCFSVTAKESIERRYNAQNTTAESRSVSVALLSPLYIGVLYFLGREITQMVSKCVCFKKKWLICQFCV